MQLTIVRPDDWHLHLRDGAALAAVVAVGGVTWQWGVPAAADTIARMIDVELMKSGCCK